MSRTSASTLRSGSGAKVAERPSRWPRHVEHGNQQSLLVDRLGNGGPRSDHRVGVIPESAINHHLGYRCPGQRDQGLSCYDQSNRANAAARADQIEPALIGGKTSPLLSATIVNSGGSAASSRSSAAPPRS
jgi:hypothetical protein